MMSTAEEVKAEMFGDNPPAGHHDGGGPLLAKPPPAPAGPT